MMMTEKFSQIDAIDAARIVARARPQWDPPGIVAALYKICHELTIDQALTAAMRAAKDTEARTPDAITWDKYRPAATLGTPPGVKCRDHPTFEANNCRCCWSEVKTGQRPRNRIGQHHEAAPQEAGQIADEEEA